MAYFYHEFHMSLRDEYAYLLPRGGQTKEGEGEMLINIVLQCIAVLYLAKLIPNLRSNTPISLVSLNGVGFYYNPLGRY